MTEAARALRATSAAGEFFTVDGPPVGRGWSTLRDLIRQPASLERRLGLVRRALARPAAVVPGDVPTRTTASMDLLGLSARVLSPALGAAVLTGTALGLDLDRTWWRHGPQRLAISDATTRSVTTAQDAAEALHSGVVTPVLAPLVDAYAARYGVSGKVLWGNVASALNGAVVVLESSGLAQLLDVRAIVTALLRTTLLTGTVRSTAPRFVRNSCCLYYRIPGAGLCGDCVLSAS